MHCGRGSFGSSPALRTSFGPPRFFFNFLISIFFLFCLDGTTLTLCPLHLNLNHSKKKKQVVNLTSTAFAKTVRKKLGKAVADRGKASLAVSPSEKARCPVLQSLQDRMRVIEKLLYIERNTVFFSFSLFLFFSFSLFLFFSFSLY